MQDGLVRCRTTNYDRTIRTLQGVLTGLYPEGAGAGRAIPVRAHGSKIGWMRGDEQGCLGKLFAQGMGRWSQTAQHVQGSAEALRFVNTE